MKIIIIILLVIAYISIIAEGFMQSISEGLVRLGIVSVIFAVIIPLLTSPYKDNKNNNYDKYYKYNKYEEYDDDDY